MTETAVPTPTNKVSMLFTGWTWLAHHVVLFILAVIICVGAVYETDSIISKRDDANSTKWNSILQTQTEQTAALQKEIAANEKESAARDAQYQKTISDLAKTIGQRNVQNEKQQKVDATLGVAQAAERLASQTQAKPGEIVATDSGISLDLPIARSIVSSLDFLPVAESNLKDTQQQLAAQQGITTDAVADDQKQKQLVANLQTQVLDGDKACLAQVTALKAKNRKSKIKVFFVGYIAGFITGATAHLW